MLAAQKKMEKGLLLSILISHESVPKNEGWTLILTAIIKQVIIFLIILYIHSCMGGHIYLCLYSHPIIADASMMNKLLPGKE